MTRRLFIEAITLATLSAGTLPLLAESACTAELELPPNKFVTADAALLAKLSGVAYSQSPVMRFMGRDGTVTLPAHCYLLPLLISTDLKAVRYAHLANHLKVILKANADVTHLHGLWVTPSYGSEVRSVFASMI